MRTWMPDLLRVIAVVMMAYGVIATLHGPQPASPGQHLHAAAVP